MRQPPTRLILQAVVLDGLLMVAFVVRGRRAPRGRREMMGARRGIKEKEENWKGKIEKREGKGKGEGRKGTFLMDVPIVPWVILGVSMFVMTALFFGIARSHSSGV